MTPGSAGWRLREVNTIVLHRHYRCPLITSEETACHVVPSWFHLNFKLSTLTGKLIICVHCPSSASLSGSTGMSIIIATGHWHSYCCNGTGRPTVSVQSVLQERHYFVTILLWEMMVKFGKMLNKKWTLICWYCFCEFYFCKNEYQKRKKHCFWSHLTDEGMMDEFIDQISGAVA